MLSKFESYIKDQFPYLLKEKSIVCCSGGVDSIVLFNLMLSVNKNFVVAHCNFKLRADDSCLLYTSPSPRDVEESRMPSSA